MKKKKTPPFLLFETSLPDKDNLKSYLFTDPVDIIKVNNFKDVRAAFEKIEKYSRDHFLAGYFAYELGYYFEDFSITEDSFPFPLIYLLVFDKISPSGSRTPHIDDFSVGGLKFDVPKAVYINKVRQIKKYIEDGDTYQVNFTGRYHFDFRGSPFSFYQDLKRKQSVPYGAFCQFGDECVISLSPELFFRRDGSKIISKPMKGTIGRGVNSDEDRAKIAALKASEKDLSENLMIVDLIRNDLGRICKAGSVKTSDRFKVERYNTLFQMTSTVEGRLKEGVTYFDIFRNIFPGGSVTGAPKIRTMRIIKELESGYRKLYCGALGIIFPGKKAVFNMPIRTVRLTGNRAEMGVGSGIVYDSNPVEEYKECLLKAKFLSDRSEEFNLLETILWDGKFRFLKAHLERMNASAGYFGFDFRRKIVIAALTSAEKRFKRSRKYRVRLLLNRESKPTIKFSEIVKSPPLDMVRVTISRHRTDTGNIFYYHKTTNRKLYDREYKKHSLKGYADVIFLNKKGEVTEGAISNIIIEKAGRYYTPPVSSGLLPGIYRDYFIKRYKAKEKAILLKDLKGADKVFICNSVRGLAEVRIK